MFGYWIVVETEGKKSKGKDGQCSAWKATIYTSPWKEGSDKQMSSSSLKGQPFSKPPAENVTLGFDPLPCHHSSHCS